MSRTGMPVARSLHSNSSQSRSASLKRLRPSAVRSMRPSRPIRSYQRSVCCVSPHFSAASLVVQPVTTSSRVDVRAHSNANRRTSPGSGHGGGNRDCHACQPSGGGVVGGGGVCGGGVVGGVVGGGVVVGGVVVGGVVVGGVVVGGVVVGGDGDGDGEGGVGGGGGNVCDCEGDGDDEGDFDGDVEGDGWSETGCTTMTGGGFGMRGAGG